MLDVVHCMLDVVHGMTLWTYISLPTHREGTVPMSPACDGM